MCSGMEGCTALTPQLGQTALVVVTVKPAFTVRTLTTEGGSQIRRLTVEILLKNCRDQDSQWLKLNCVLR